MELIWSFGICIRWINNIQVIKFILHRFCCLLITNLLSFFLNRGVKSNKLLVKTCCLLEASTIWHDLYYTLKDDFSILGELCYVKLEKLTHSRHLVSLHFFLFLWICVDRCFAVIFIFNFIFHCLCLSISFVCFI